MGYALITGASSGIGLELARIMAGAGHDLILVARRENVLQELKARWEQEFRIKVEVRAVDLSVPGQTQALHEYCRTQGFTVDCLVNNAGYGDYGKFAADKLDIYRNMVQLNVMALTELTALFVSDMKQRKFGKILNVGSIAAFQPGPGFSVYAATKAYVMHFTEALNYELRGTGVSATTLSPGVTETGFVARANMGEAAIAHYGAMPAAQVAAAGYEAMVKGKLNVVTGWKNRLLAFGSKTMPSREILLRISALLLRNTTTKQA